MCTEFTEQYFLKTMDLPDIRILSLPGYYHCEKIAQKEQKDKYVGRFFKTNDNHCRIIIGDETNRFCYRGENKIYPNFVSSINRCKNELEHCVQWIKTDQFKEAFKTTPYYKILPKKIKIMNKYNFEFDLDAIAQHYEFKTNYLDITMNREVAEFFAYTYVDNNGEYKPITDFKKYHPIIYRAGLDELIRYSPDKIKIVGFQAVLRPLLQQAMAIKIEEQNDNLKKQFFKVEELEQSSKKANEVYNKFHGGYDLLKPDAMNTLKEQLNSTNAFLPQASVVRYCYHFGKQYSKIRIMLQRNRYKILDSTLTPHPLLEEYMRNVTDLMINWINKNVGFKPTFWI